MWGFLRKTQRRFRERRHMEENAEGREHVDGDGDEDEDEEAAHGGVVGWKEKWVRLLSFALGPGVAGLIIRRAVARCPTGGGWRWAGGGRVRGDIGPDLDRGEAARREGEWLVLMDRAWEGTGGRGLQVQVGGGRAGSRAGRRQRGGPERGLGGEEMARVARVAEVSRLQRHSSSAPAGQSQRGSALELSSAEYRVALRHILHAEQPLLGQVEECPDCGGERDPTGTHLLGCRGGAGAGGGNWYSFIHHKLQRVLFEVAKSAYPLASALHDDFAGHLTYSPNHCPDVTVLDAEGPGQHVLFDVATARPMSDAHLGAAMMAPGAAAKKVEESKVATYGDVRPHHFIPFGVEVYGGLGPAAYGFLQKMQRCFRERRYMEENVEGGEQVDGDGDEDRDEETTHDGTVGWKEKWIRQLSFALARGVAGLIIRRAVGRCPAGVGWRWAGGGRVREGMGPNPDRGEAAQREGVERLALMDRAWEDAIEEIDYATQDGSGGGTQGSGGTQDEQSEQASGGADEAGAMAARLLESMEDVRREAEHLRTGRDQGGAPPRRSLERRMRARVGTAGRR
ncbi:hypothetical protein CYMTET_50851 [Cymbomonas tetramitiformis]|uniref:Uncharacterized protein n=1 Tax=Cymbomonas tetramitiformis TaxID=36881 RepID=A0AAE0EUC0_9CHLO|nr:hypothetical protein CYMTET_50851 [Cymbomonas tetramitiformis]